MVYKRLCTYGTRSFGGWKSESDIIAVIASEARQSREAGSGLDEIAASLRSSQRRGLFYRVTAFLGNCSCVAYMDVGEGREQERKLYSTSCIPAVVARMN